MNQYSSSLTNKSNNLNFETPSSFIKSLRSAVNHSLRQDRIPHNHELGIKNSDGYFVNTSDSWTRGKSEYTIHALGIKRPILTLVVYDLDYKVWFRYKINDKNWFVNKEHKLLLSIVNNLLSEFLLIDNDSINIAPIPKNHQLSIPTVTLIKPNVLLIPFGIIYMVSLLSNLHIYIQYIPFLLYVYLTVQLHNFSTKY